jgi:hypothetical protein
MLFTQRIIEAIRYSRRVRNEEYACLASELAKLKQELKKLEGKRVRSHPI